MPRIHRLVLLLCLSVGAQGLFAQQKVWLFLKDKGPEQSRWEAMPETCLSPRAIARRQALGIGTTVIDWPVSATYVQMLERAGLKVHATSRWMNAVSVETNRSLRELHAICPAVVGMQPVARFVNTRYNTAYATKAAAPKAASVDSFSYGEAQIQIDQLNMACLHERGFTGRDVLIAVFDAGFFSADTIAAFDSLWQQGRVLTYYDFVNHDSTVFDENNHGMNVMSTIVAHLPGEMVGTAPHATLALARTENVGSETNQEEDNWMMAVEWADSLGADMIQSSLGYTTFDSGSVSYTYGDLDGNTTIVSRAADIAASRGILVVNSAGNEGNGPWHHISAPCDADSILCVGAVDFLNGYVSFSGVGPSADGQVKPDVVALGLFTAIIGNNGQVAHSSGTSFAAPLMAGFAACLRGAHPQRSNMDIIHAIQQSAHQYANPDTLLGYGIPDACKADSILTAWDSLGMGVAEPGPRPAAVAVYPNPAGDQLVLENRIPQNPIRSITVTAADGKTVLQLAGQAANGNRTQLSLRSLSAGVYIVHITLQDAKTQTTRFIRK